MKKSLILFFLLAFSQSTFSQKKIVHLQKLVNYSQKKQNSPAATYTFIGLGNWSNSANWQGGILPPNPLPAGDLITIAGTKPCDMDVNQTIQSGGTISIAPGKTLSIPASSTFTLAGIMVNNGITEWASNGPISLNSVSPNSISGSNGVLNIFASVITVSTNITFTGTGALNLTATSNILVQSPSVISVQNGNINLKANQLAGSSGDLSGIKLTAATLKTIGTGNIILNGKGLNHDTDKQYGVSLEQGAIIESTATLAGGQILITGLGGISTTFNGIAECIGVHITTATIRTITGNIEINGTGASTKSSNTGIVVSTNGVISSTGSGNIKVVGAGSATGFSENNGILIQNTGAKISSTGGIIEIIGQGNGSGTGSKNKGVRIINAANIVTTGTATTKINGTSSTSSTFENYGVEISGANTLLNTVNGNIEITGISNGRTISNNGVTIIESAKIASTGLGKIMINGTGSSSATNTNFGILIEDAVTEINSTGGNIELIGISGGTGSSNIGINASSNPIIKTTGNARIFMNGTGATNGTSYCMGVILSGRISTEKEINVTGLGKGANTNNTGIFVSTGSVTATGPGIITLNGTGGGSTTGNNSNVGVNMAGNATINTINGALQITATAGAGDNNGFRQENNVNGNKIISTGLGAITITATGSGNFADIEAAVANNLIGGPTATGGISINANTYNGGPMQSTGILSFTPRTSNISIGIGDTAPGTLHFNATEIGFLANGFSLITIGDFANGNGNVAINTATFLDPISIIGGKIAVTALNTGTNNLTLNARTGSINDINDLATDITCNGTLTILHQIGALAPGNSPAIFSIVGNYSQGGELAIEIGGIAAGTQFDQLAVTGSVTLNSALNMTLINSYNPISGEIFDIITASNIIGTFSSHNLPTGWSIIYNANSVQIKAPIAAPLPLNLLHFSGKSTENGNELTWKTSNETNFSHFEIQRSPLAPGGGISNEKLKKIGVKFSYKNSDESNNYEFHDSTPPSGAGGLYRLKLIDLDGKYSYSKIISIQNEAKFSFNIYPNPVIDNLNITANLLKSGNYQIQVLNEIGQVKSAEFRFLKAGQNQISISSNSLQKGMYFVTIQNEMDLNKVFKFVK